MSDVISDAFRPRLTADLLSRGRVFDAVRARADFPILSTRVHGRPLVYLDNAATTQKPQAVLDRLMRFYEQENGNAHRAAHTLAARATHAYEAARDTVARFIGAESSQQIVFVRGATEGLNLVAETWGRRHLKADDEIVVTWIEHHSNIVPWQRLAASVGATLRVVPVNEAGDVQLDRLDDCLSPRTRLVATTHVSNALGTVVPVREIVERAARVGARVVVDGAQAVPHLPVDVRALGVDFYVFSGHKIYAPTGIGVLYGRAEALAECPPWQAGGQMVADVSFERTVYHPAPLRFEAGTGHLAGAVGLAAALDYLRAHGLAGIAAHEHQLLGYAAAQLAAIPGVRVIGTPAERAGVLSFVLNGTGSHDLAAALDRHGIAVRAGHHCAQPALRRYGLESTVRASLALYNTRDDIDALAASVDEFVLTRRS